MAGPVSPFSGIEPLSSARTFIDLQAQVTQLAAGVIPTLALDLGSRLTPASADVVFHSNGSAVPDALLRSTGGSGSSYGGTLILAAAIANLQAKLTAYKPQTLVYTGSPGDATSQVVGKYEEINNSGPAGYGFRQVYRQNGNATSGFSLASSIQADFVGLNGAQGQVQWLVAQTPRGQTHPFGVTCVEFNPVNLGGDTGYLDTRSGSLYWTVGQQIVPESRDLLSGSTLGAYPIIAAYVVARSSSMSSAIGWYAQSYNGLLIEKDSIAPNGVGVQVGGSVLRTTGGTLPKFGVRVAAAWSDAALDTRDAIISSGNAITVASGQKVCFAGTDYALYQSGGKLYFDVGGVHKFSIDASGNAKFAGTVTASTAP